MKIEKMLEIRRKLFLEADRLAIMKARGYGSEDDVLANFKLTENIGVMPSELGAWVRLSDKVVRLGRLLQKGENYVLFEGIIDTILDGINYLAVIAALLYEKDNTFRQEFNKRFSGGEDDQGVFIGL